MLNMCQVPEKTPIFLTATQLKLLGQAVTGHIRHVASRMTDAHDMRAARGDLSLLSAYVELAKLIINPDDLTPEGDNVIGDLGGI
jgi:hypothetical protein